MILSLRLFFKDEKIKEIYHFLKDLNDSVRGGIIQILPIPSRNKGMLEGWIKLQKLCISPIVQDLFSHALYGHVNVIDDENMVFVIIKTDERTFKCVSNGAVGERDLPAIINLLEEFLGVDY
ncbi:MAG: hypothetical protein ACXQS8_08740 [Candidatus Helarchaeales archaeon]